ncbi:MAG: MFS transporter [Prevotellaceae bacterium]|nr:MFS transporter [Prevotellaceae bacterium]
MIQSRRINWLLLFTTNFLGVFNDNFLKHCIIFVAISWNLPTWLTQSQLISLVSAALVVPYLVLSPFAAKLSRTHRHQTVLEIAKLAELPIMAVACVAFINEWVWLALVSVLLMGIQSSLYSPAKYSLIRDIGGEKGVSYGSGIFESMAFLGILVGTVMAATISDNYSTLFTCSLFLILAIMGYYGARNIRTQEHEIANESQTIRPIKFIIDSYRFARHYPLLNLGVFGASFLWFIGGILQMNLVIYCHNELQLTNSSTGIMMAMAAIGIAAGCFVTGQFSGTTIRKNLIPAGLGGISILLALLLLIKPTALIAGIFIFGIAFFGGVFQVPCLALIQKSNVGGKLSDMIAYTNLITFIFIVGGTIIFSIITTLSHENAYHVFGVLLIICCLLFIFFVAKLHQVSQKNVTDNR